MPVEDDVVNQEFSDLKIREKDERYNWYVFYVKGRHEQKAAELLQRDGYVSYLPMLSTKRQYTDRKKTISEPIFKSYLFVLIQSHEIYEVIKTPGVVNYVRFSGKPATIRQSQIDLIRKIIKNKTEFDVSSRKVKIGDQITLTSGNFKGQKGVVKQLRGKKRLLVALETIDFTLEIVL